MMEVCPELKSCSHGYLGVGFCKKHNIFDPNCAHECPDINTPEQIAEWRNNQSGLLIQDYMARQDDKHRRIKEALQDMQDRIITDTDVVRIIQMAKE